ncbi:MAG: M14 family zinc carboxypeptidase [Proteobacteria bacterium]|nr:M14 family zinc carboxypeptidase [Pseudomonadota bacterium]
MAPNSANALNLLPAAALPRIATHPDIRRRLPELFEIEDIAALCQHLGKVTVEGTVDAFGHRFPIYSFVFGSSVASDPTIAFVGGVHGLERIGTNVAISYLRTIVELLQWDKGLQHLLGKCRLVFLPLVNPAGMFAKTRSNANGVDLMRNAPIEAEIDPNIPLVGGHRKSPKLPWYRGEEGAAMEAEAQLLISFVKRELFPSRFSLALDMHSGFGMQDRLWFPYAYTRRPFEYLPMMYALKTRLQRSLPNHVYVMEPQSLQYVTHGDLWDYMFLEFRREMPDRVLLPLTLEMGSWIWIKKNPRQLFSSLGIFNPVLPHRIQRTLRRHHALLDFLIRAVMSHENWATPEKLTEEHEQLARQLWYGGVNP